MGKTWKKGGRTYDTDRYNSLYHNDGDTFYKCVWEESPFIGPDAYNRSHIELIMENHNNDVNRILDPTNPLYRVRGTSSPDRVKFAP